MVHGESLPDTESSAHGEQVQQPWNTLAKKDYKVATADGPCANEQAATNAPQVEW